MDIFTLVTAIVLILVFVLCMATLIPWWTDSKASSACGSFRQFSDISEYEAKGIFVTLSVATVIMFLTLIYLLLQFW